MDAQAHIKISAKAEAKAKEKRILDRWTQLLRAAEVQQRMVAQPAEAVLSEDEVRHRVCLAALQLSFQIAQVEEL